jgi:hypothetical protein
MKLDLAGFAAVATKICSVSKLEIKSDQLPISIFALSYTTVTKGHLHSPLGPQLHGNTADPEYKQRYFTTK